MDRVRALDDVTFSEWFEGSGGSRGSIKRLWDPIAYALGFIDCDHISARCMLTIFQLFAVRSEASVLRMCEGSPDTYLHKPIVKYLTDRGVKINLKSRVLDILHDVRAALGRARRRARGAASAHAAHAARARRALPLGRSTRTARRRACTASASSTATTCSPSTAST